MDRLRGSYAKPGIKYVLDFPEEGCVAMVHAKYFSMLLDSLLDNANKFTDSGVITLSCRADRSNSEAVFSVTDTGCGIPEDKLGYIFERFTKTNLSSPGTGLGLYLSRLIIERMGGRIWVDTGYTGGTRVSFAVRLSDIGQTHPIQAAGV